MADPRRTDRRPRCHRDPPARAGQGLARAVPPPHRRRPRPAGVRAGPAGRAPTPFRPGAGDRRGSPGRHRHPAVHAGPARRVVAAGRRRRGCVAVGRAALEQCRPRAHRGADAGDDHLPGHARHVDGDLAAQAGGGDGASARRAVDVLAAGVDGVARDRHPDPRRRCGDIAPPAADRAAVARRADRAGRLDQRQLCGAGLRHRFSEVRRPVVAAARCPRRLRVVARDRRGLRRRHSRQPGAHRDPAGAPADGGAGHRPPADAGDPPAAQPGPARLGQPAGLLVCVQVGLGIANVVLSLPLHVAIAHNAGATALLFVLVSLLARVRAPDA